MLGIGGKKIKILRREYTKRQIRKCLRKQRDVYYGGSAVFRRIKKKHINAYQGPHLTEEGKIVGDQESTERYYFGRYALPLQQKVYQQLFEQDREIAEEYMLTICRAIDKWKKDIDELEDTYDELEDAREKLEHTHKENAAKLVKKRFPHVLEERFPADSKNLKQDLQKRDNNKFFIDFTNMIYKARDLANRLLNYFAELKQKKKMGFLFR